MPNGINFNSPAPWLIKELNLRFNSQTLTWNDIQGNIVIKNINLYGSNCSLINFKAIEKKLSTDLTFISVYLSERGAWSQGSNNKVSWVRAEGICWKVGKRIMEKVKVTDSIKN